MFNPIADYLVEHKPISVKDFHEYLEDFVVRPPYQRMTVWTTKRQQQLLDSLIRRFYIPRIVLREVRLDEHTVKKEVIDGQQRINTIQKFYADEIRLPKSLSDISEDMPGKAYSSLPVAIRKYIDKELVYNADIVKGLDDPRNELHQQTAADIFWRLQQGVSLNTMEKAHSRLSSLPRNFVVKYADDISFDYERYEPIEENNSKHGFFKVINRKNDRMQHLALLTRFLVLESENGPTDIKDTEVTGFIESGCTADGIGNYSYEETEAAKAVLGHMGAFAQAFEGDLIGQSTSVRELNTEYFIISAYLLLRHLRNNYVVKKEELDLFHQFILDFHRRWVEDREGDADIHLFSEKRQQSSAEIEVRDRIIRQAFFRWIGENGNSMIVKDTKRAFDEGQRIYIYRRDEGLCQTCLSEGKPEIEARVAWSEYEADHIVAYTRGGQTEVENGQVLCRYHNRAKLDS